MKKQMHVIFSGRVQGVGFRYTACHLASKFKITGFVRNLPDGKVKLVGEGDEGELDLFLKEIGHSNLGSYIRDQKILWSDYQGVYDCFEIAY